MKTWLIAGIGAGLVILSSLYMATEEDNIMPLAIVCVIVFLTYLSWTKVSVSMHLPTPAYSQFDLFRDLEPSDQTRVNPWVGFLQEDVYKDKYGPIGDFEGNIDKAQMYEFDVSSFTEILRATDIPSCKNIEKDLSTVSKDAMTAAEQKCFDDIISLQG